MATRTRRAAARRPTSRKGATPVAAAERTEKGTSEAAPDTRRGSLVVVGTGIKTVGQMTPESIAWIEKADSVLYVVGDPIAEEAIKQLNPRGAVSMAGYYSEGESRMYAYNAMVEHILRCVRSGEVTVGAFYGHPGV